MHTIITAEFTAKTKRFPASVTIYEIRDGRRDCRYWQVVGTKRDARQVAVAHNATPWNF